MRVEQAAYWSTYYKFYTFSAKTIKISKQKLKTWGDLISAISVETAFKQNTIEIFIDNQRVDYDIQTELIDIDIDKQARCLVLKRQQFQTDKEKADYFKNKEELKKKCKQDLDQIYGSLEIKKMADFVEGSYTRLFLKIVRKYRKLECLVAIYQCNGEEQLVIEYIESRKAAEVASQIQKQNEQNWLRKFLSTKNMQQLQRFIQEKRIEQMAYRAIMQKVYEAHPRFKQLQFKHRQFVKKILYGKAYQEPPKVDQRQQQIENVQKSGLALLSLQEQQKFVAEMRASGFTKQDINEALVQSLNNLGKAKYLLQNGFIRQIQHFPLLIKKSGRINYLLQFFANPKFDQIRQKLYNNRAKAESFLQFLAAKNTNNPIFCELIKKYKSEAVAFLTGTFVVQKKQKAQQKLINQPQQAQLSQLEQSELRQKIKNTFDKKIVQTFVKKGYQRNSAEMFARAGNLGRKLEQQYLQLKGIPRQFEICQNDRKSQQTFIFKKLKNQKELLTNLRNEKEKNVWLASISETSPFFFAAIVRNYKYFNSLVTKEQ